MLIGKSPDQHESPDSAARCKQIGFSCVHQRRRTINGHTSRIPTSMNLKSFWILSLGHRKVSFYIDKWKQQHWEFNPSVFTIVLLVLFIVWNSIFQCYFVSFVRSPVEAILAIDVDLGYSVKFQRWSSFSYYNCKQYGGLRVKPVAVSHAVCLREASYGHQG